MQDDRSWIGQVLDAVYQHRVGDEPARTFAALAERIDARNDSVSDALERIAGELKA